MEFVKWKEEYSVSNNFIDDQHKELFKLINAFYNNIKDNSGKAAILQAIGEMERYTLTHFVAEEMMMAKAGYKNIEEHKNEHKQFIENVASLRKRYEDGRLILSL